MPLVMTKLFWFNSLATCMHVCMYVSSLLGNYVNGISQLFSCVGTQGLQACLSLQPNVQVIPSPFSVGLLCACKAIHGDNAFLLETTSAFR